MRYLIVYTFYFSIVLLIITIALSNYYRNIFFQKISYMNRVLNDINLNTFRLNKSFNATIDFENRNEPMIKGAFMENGDYYAVVKDYELKKKILKKVQLVLMSMVGVLIIIILLN